VKIPAKPELQEFKTGLFHRSPRVRLQGTFA
jgi:hypothetical protein